VSFLRALGLLILLGSLSGCSFTLNWIHYLRARRAIAQHDYKTALNLLHEVIVHEPDSDGALNAARTGARVAHLEAKNYPLAIEFYRLIVLRSPDAEERLQAQVNIAQIYFENLLDYDEAVEEYERLLRLQLKPDDAFHFRLNLAKSHFQLNNLEQAGNELDVLLAQKHTSDEVFEAKVLRANILVAQKKQADAAVLWQDIMKEFPERSKKENVALNLVVCYEEQKDFGKAVEVLERMKADYPNPEFLDVRIQRLKERQSNQPGAQGLKR
jgi:tetratricopeptide (TPR) repeat protein